jgi:hypothetical protein
MAEHRFCKVCDIHFPIFDEAKIGKSSFFWNSDSFEKRDIFVHSVTIKLYIYIIIITIYRKQKNIF